ncbi:MAG: MFS transporter [Gammaproteobacteria bacterium]|nr:MFS transporter [Gammaproteobacteria bacterium]
MRNKTKQDDPNAPDQMTATEKKAVSSLSGIYALRMFGLFMILPVFSLYAQELEDVTPFLIGIAIGAYGLTQAAFQLPFGMMSDRIGRKPVIAMGLVIFAIGSVVAAMSDSIYGVIIGRALQGSGAIAAAIMAMTADLTREEHRVRAMASIGMSIGFSFAIALVAGPALDRWIGVDGLFWLTAVLAIAAIFIIYVRVPTPTTMRFHRDAQPVPQQFKTVLRDPELLRLDFGIFVLHMALTATFVVLPIALRDHAGLATEHHWWIYFPIMVIAMVVMVPFVVVAEKRRRMKQILTGAVFILAISELLLLISYDTTYAIFLSLGLFFIAFNVLEATLPSMIVKVAPPDIKGTAMGVYSSCQFLGAFVGGAAGGYIYGEFGIGAVFAFAAAALVAWGVVTASMRNPRYLGSFMVRVGEVDERRARQLVEEMTAVQGVAEAVVIPEDGVAYLKVDNNAVDKVALMRFAVQSEA